MGEQVFHESDGSQRTDDNHGDSSNTLAQAQARAHAWSVSSASAVAASVRKRFSSSSRVSALCARLVRLSSFAAASVLTAPDLASDSASRACSSATVFSEAVNCSHDATERQEAVRIHGVSGHTHTHTHAHDA
jgi:hypothetical protein